MTQPTSHQIIAASLDADLRARLRALGSSALEGSETDAVQRLVSTPITVNGEETSIAAVFEYAALVRAQLVAALPPAPGADPAAVTDDHLRAALEAVQST